MLTRRKFLGMMGKTIALAAVVSVAPSMLLKSKPVKPKVPQLLDGEPSWFRFTIEDGVTRHYWSKTGEYGTWIPIDREQSPLSKGIVHVRRGSDAFHDNGERDVRAEIAVKDYKEWRINYVSV